MITSSRYGVARFIHHLKDNVYEIYGDSLYMRCNGLNDNLDSIDYEGGPMISVGEEMKYYGGEGIIERIVPFSSSDKPNHYIIYTTCSK